MGKTIALSHVTPDGAPHMVDVSAKAMTHRTAAAEARVRVGDEIACLIKESGQVAKGDVLDTAKLAGIMAAKKTADLIPLCHPLQIEAVNVKTTVEGSCVLIRTEAKCDGRTGVEMEAMTAAAVAALTVYDMCKSASKSIVIEHIRLEEKAGGESGRWSRTTSDVGEVVAVCTSPRKGERKAPVPRAVFARDYGIVGDAHAGSGHRQVSILADEDIETVRRLDGEIPPGYFAENLVLSGLDLSALGMGSTLRLGDEILLSISQIGKECSGGCALHETTPHCIMPQHSLFARVVCGGELKPGDQAEVVEAAPRKKSEAIVLTTVGE